jgi:hypothetical protein
MNKRYEVQEDTICDGWTNTDEHLYDMQKAYNMGDISTPEDRDNFRIVEITK